MKITSLFILLLSFMGLCNIEMFNFSKMETSTFYELSATTIDGAEYKFEQLAGKKVLIVNTASECGLTPQYEQLQELHESLGSESFIILGFPANNFGAQEPGTETEIQSFCQKNYGVTFQMMSKVSVKGADQDPVYKWLTSKKENGLSDFEVQWNFHKFLIDENGQLVREVTPQILPTDDIILSWIEDK